MVDHTLHLPCIPHLPASQPPIRDLGMHEVPLRMTSALPCPQMVNAKGYGPG